MKKRFIGYTAFSIFCLVLGTGYIWYYHYPQIKQVYYPNGKIQTETTYQGGVKHGESKVFYENGTLRLSITYAKGRIKGAFKQYYPNGNIMSEFTRYGEKLDGPQTLILLFGYKDLYIFCHCFKIAFGTTYKFFLDNFII